MSNGGVTQLITNNGIQDKLIMATDKLMKRLQQISYEKLTSLRHKYPYKSDKELLSMDSNWTPTLNSIEKSHIMFVNSSFKPFVAMTHEYSRTPPRKGKAELGNTFSFTLPIIGEFVNDAVMYIKISGLSAVSALDKVRYVEFLGHRLMKKVAIKVQNHLFDEYGSDEMNAYWQYKVPIQKETGYLRNIGQEVPKIGYLTADPTVDEVREYRLFGDGPQTFKQKQLDVEMWIPLLFWFKDIKTALPNFILPMNQTDIEITLEEGSKLIAFADHGGGGKYNIPTVSECFLYVNHLFLLPEINRIFVSRFGFQLIRVHRRQDKTILDTDSKSIRLNGLKWPVECIYIGFRPISNETNSKKWHRNTFINEKSVKQAVVTGVATVQVNSAVYLDEQEPISSLELTAHDVKIYPSLPPAFYNSYLPFRYGERTKTPKDLGWYMMNFNFNPGEYQPSGHFNVSQERELYLNYISAIDSSTGNPIINKSNPARLIVLADCINFLLFNKGSATLRFST